MTTLKTKLYRSVINDTQSPYSAQGNPNQKIVNIGAYNIPNRDRVVLDGKLTPIRYIKGSDTIILSEQIAYGFPENRQDSPDDKINMQNGLLVSVPSDVALAQYLEVCNYNGSNPNRLKDGAILFYGDNSAELAREANHKVKDVTKAKATVYDLEGDDLIAFAKSLKERNYPAIVIDSMDEDSIRRQLLAICDENPAAISTAFVKTNIDISELVYKAFDVKILGMSRGTVHLMEKDENGEKVYGEKIAITGLNGDFKAKVIKELLNDGAKLEKLRTALNKAALDVLDMQH